MLQTHRVRTLDQVRSFLDGAEPVEVRPRTAARTTSSLPTEAGDSPGAAAATPRARRSSDRPRDALHRGPPDGPGCAPPAPSTRTREPASRACDTPPPRRRAHHPTPVLRRVRGTSFCHRDASSAQWPRGHQSGATPVSAAAGTGGLFRWFDLIWPACRKLQVAPGFSLTRHTARRTRSRVRTSGHPAATAKRKTGSRLDPTVGSVAGRRSSICACSVLSDARSDSRTGDTCRILGDSVRY